MESRLEYDKEAPGAYKAFLGLETYLHHSSLEASLLELVKMRASMINGCAYCLDMHSKDARAKGESEQRLYGLSAWRETPYYTERERAALAYADTMTRDIAVPDDVFAEVKRHFNTREIVELTVLVGSYNMNARVVQALQLDLEPVTP